MSCGPCDEKKKRGRDMTRGEFLGVGGGAAVVATMGATADPGEEGLQSACAKPTDCGPDAKLQWRVSASVLQVIWGEILPRLVAYKWKHGNFPPPLDSFNHGAISAGDLIEVAHKFLADADGGSSGLTCGLNSTTGRFECTFPGAATAMTRMEQRVKILTDKLHPGGGLAPIPIRLVATGGFDFLLSDQGLDLFVPEKPQNRLEILRFYQFREPGRSAIGIPDYLDAQDALAFDVHAPMGPSQVWSGSFTPVNQGGCSLAGLGQACLPLAPFDPRDGVRLFEGEGDPVTFTVRDYKAAKARITCWQVEGSVYRGILEQLPRVVATIWRERLLKCTCTGTCACPTDPQSYDARWGTARMREIFMERLETALPNAQSMVFDADTGGALADVMISNKGFRFPAISDPPPTLDEMFTAISTGRAGNPVFTDTRRPPRNT